MASPEAIQAYTKLDESAFFLEKLKELRDTSVTENIEQNFYFSAFLHAWKGVLDVLLYDFAIIFDLGFDRKDRMIDSYFRWAAKRLDHQEALRFLTWWRQKKGELGKSALWQRRDFFTHRGYEHGDEFLYLGAPSFKASDFDLQDFHTGSLVVDVDFDSIILACKEALKAAETIVEEAERSFLSEK